MARLLTLIATTLIAATPLAATPALAGDAAAGRAYFKATCAMCHGDTARSPAGVGPRLFGVVGRKAGSLPGYSYSKAVAGAGFTWTPAKLLEWVTKPGAVVPGNKMPFAGVAKPADRENVIAYLETLR